MSDTLIPRAELRTDTASMRRHIANMAELAFAFSGGAVMLNVDNTVADILERFGTGLDIVQMDTREFVLLVGDIFDTNTTYVE